MSSTVLAVEIKRNRNTKEKKYRLEEIQKKWGNPDF